LRLFSKNAEYNDRLPGTEKKMALRGSEGELANVERLEVGKTSRRLRCDDAQL
jgi:hypothetical protein